MSCGWSGDILAFTMQKYLLSFVEACIKLEVWEAVPETIHPRITRNLTVISRNFERKGPK
jgi:hypothetical protein